MAPRGLPEPLPFDTLDVDDEPLPGGSPPGEVGQAVLEWRRSRGSAARAVKRTGVKRLTQEELAAMKPSERMRAMRERRR